MTFTLPKSMLTTVNIIQGGKASGFKNVQEATASMNPNRLYQVRGTNELNTRANEVSLQSDQYDSRKLKKGELLTPFCQHSCFL